MRALGATESWKGCTSLPDEVFVWRAEVRGARLSRPTDAMLFARAVGRLNRWGHDVRAVLVAPLGGGRFAVDVVMTVRTAVLLHTDCMPIALITGRQTAERIAEQITREPAIAARFPQLQIHRSQLLELTGPDQAVAFWLAHHKLWDKTAPTGPGVPTSKYGAAEGAYVGRADDAPNVTPLRASQLDKTPGSTTRTLLWVGGAIVVVLVAAHFLTPMEAA